MRAEHTVDSWLRNLPSIAPQVGTNKRKRRSDEDQRRLASPPTSGNEATRYDETGMSGTPKKRRADRPDAGDVDATPRPSNAPAGHVSLSWSEASSGSISRVSSGSSPKKQRLALRLIDAGIEIKAVDVEYLPTELQPVADLIGAIQDVGDSNGILPRDMEAAFREQLQVRGLDFRPWQRSFHDDDDDGPSLPGRLPSLDQVVRIQREALECQKHGHEEFSWNSQVHLRLLEAVFKDADGQCDAFGFTSCMTARPHRQFKVPTSPAKMVDLCIYSSLADDDECMARMNRLCRQSPTQTVNHTDFEPIRTRPLVLSIETKKPGENWDKAQLQMGLWHAAQWSFLAWAVGKKLAAGADQADDDNDDDQPDMTHELTGLEEKRRAALSALGCIPGVIVQGHQWSLVVSSHDAKSGKTILWTGYPFGTTQGYRKIYGTVAGVRRLTAWARDVYLPWLDKHVLD